MKLVVIFLLIVVCAYFETKVPISWKYSYGFSVGLICGMIEWGIK